ncbi:MAG: carbohydrate porin [Alphaproteobacteria bacterium]
MANAACDLPESDIADGSTHIPDEAVAAIDVGGARRALSKYGIAIGGLYYAEAFQNWGGIKDGGAYDGVLELYTNADMQKLGLWKGLCFFASGYQIHGRSITLDNVGSLAPVSSLEALPATRLFELWFEQHLFNELVSVRLGQLAADAEFFISAGGGYLLNGTWGWASKAGENNPGGGPAYPLATPGVRVAVTPTEKTRLMLGIYNGEAAPECNKDGGNPQRCNEHGLDFELDDPPLLIAEGDYSYSLADGILPGVLKIGTFQHFGTFEHQRIDLEGGLIGITGNAAKSLERNWAFYAVVDQLLWSAPGSEDPQGISVFARVAGAPSDRNLIDFYFDGGFTFTGMIPSRPNDALAVGLAYTGISHEVAAFDVDSGEPIARNYEALFEITYTFEFIQGWNLQPDFQYFWNPGGNVAGIDDALVLGGRSTFRF